MLLGCMRPLFFFSLFRFEQDYLKAAVFCYISCFCIHVLHSAVTFFLLNVFICTVFPHFCHSGVWGVLVPHLSLLLSWLFFSFGLQG